MTPNFSSTWAICNEMMTPTKKRVMQMMGTASTPTRTIWPMMERQRKRVSLARPVSTWPSQRKDAPASRAMPPKVRTASRV